MEMLEGRPGDAGLARCSGAIDVATVRATFLSDVSDAVLKLTIAQRVGG